MSHDYIGKKVVLTTAHRGVFFGELSHINGKVARLKGCRNCIYWPPGNKGFIGLATSGPLDGARVGPAAEEMELRDITSVALCSDAAVEEWESGKWS